MERDYDRLVPLSESGVVPVPSASGWPTLLVCAAANVSDPGATPPGPRRDELHVQRDSDRRPAGRRRCADARSTRSGSARNRRRDITLPAAVAMSGAAISPSMGKMTRGR